tara:strand:+ start:392 stop:1747 length:1356 start_codon:yes stop_codon:yes gene_type:complete
MKALIKYYLAIPSLCLISYALQASPTILFSIHGSNTVGEKLAPQCARDYLRSIKVEDVEIHTTAVTNEYMIGGTRGQGLDMEKVAIKVAAHGSSTGFKAILSGEADIAMSSRPIKAKEVEALQAFGDMLSQQAEHTIAIDGLAILVNKTNAINALTIEQIANVFSGELTNWQQLGGNNKPITIYARDDKSGTWDTFKKLVFNGRYQLSETALRFESNTELSDQVSQNPNAIGFAGLSSVRQSKLLAISDSNTKAMKPSEFTVATEDYPLARRLFFYMPPNVSSPWVKSFVDFCQSTRGQDIVSEVGFVSQNIRAFTVLSSVSSPDEYYQLASNGERLSVNFRFSKGSSRLDNKAYRDLLRLVYFLKMKEHQEKYVYLVGFSDAGGHLNRDLILSKFRALAVYGALLKEGIDIEKSLGLGSFMPVVSNSDAGVKLKNGRVEVWITNKKLALK